MLEDVDALSINVDVLFGLVLGPRAERGELDREPEPFPVELASQLEGSGGVAAIAKDPNQSEQSILEGKPRIAYRTCPDIFGQARLASQGQLEGESLAFAFSQRERRIPGDLLQQLMRLAVANLQDQLAKLATG